MDQITLWITTYLGSPLTWICFIFGSLIGSFLNVCILRVPEGTFWKNRRSVCPQCEAPIPFYLNIPIISYFILRGKTACCKNKLSFRYPAVELFTAISFAVIYWIFPFAYDLGGQWYIDNREILRYSHATIFWSILIVCSVIDMDHQIIPDVISLPMILATPLVVYFHPDLDWKSAAIGVVAGGGLLFAISWTYWLIRKNIGMGMGDIKLLAAIGGWLGYQSIFPTIFYGSVLGSVFALLMMIVTWDFRSKPIPFGPYLAIGAMAHLTFGQRIQEFLFLSH